MEQPLIEYSSTFPEFSVPTEIPVEPKIHELTRKFDGNHHIVILSGPNGSGKTMHMVQFVKLHANRTFSYFLSDNFWILRQNAFLYSLCQQISAATGSAFNIRPEDAANTTKEQLQQVFENLVERLLIQISKKAGPYYFVIDGLEYAFKGSEGERIIDLLPLRTSARGLFFLGSVNSSEQAKVAFDHLGDFPHLFSVLETRAYLADLNFPDEDIQKIHRASGGMPGFLAVMRNLLSTTGLTLKEILKTPTEIQALLKTQWNHAKAETDSITQKLLALIAFSITPLSIDDVAQIASLPKDEANHRLAKTGLIAGYDSSKLRFYADLLGDIVRDRLSQLRHSTIAELIEFYKNQANNAESLWLVPEYYKLADDYDALSSWLVPGNISPLVQKRMSLGLAKRQLTDANSMARSQDDIFGELKFGISASQLSEMSVQLVGASEVRALVAMKDFDRALQLAYSSKLASTRVRLLAQIYLAREKDGRLIERSALIELENLARDLEQDIDKDDLLMVAADLFPLLPDFAIALLDRVKREGDESVIDLLNTITALQSKEVLDDYFSDEIQSPGFREYVALGTPWLSKLPIDALLQRVLSAERTESQEYLLRHWCLQNRRDPQVHRAIDTALDVIIADPSYKVPLRNLRQLSEAVKYCNPQYRESLARRFDIPNFTSIGTPIEERIRLELNLAEALREIASEDSQRRFQEVQRILAIAPVDIDVECYCLARMLVSLTTIDPNNKLGLRKTIAEQIESAFLKLLDSSADQLDLTRRTLRALTLVQPDLALEFADMLNLRERREAATKDVVQAYIRQETIPVDLGFVQRALSRITDYHLREHAILEIVTEARRTEKIEGADFREAAIELIGSVADPVVKCRVIAQVIASLGSMKDAQLASDLFELLQRSWGKINIAWLQVEAAFDAIGYIATATPDYARDLYELASKRRETSPLANQALGVMFYRSLEMAARAAGHVDRTKQELEPSWNRFFRAIEVLPSTLLTARLTAIVAVTRFRHGDKNTFSELVLKRILPQLRSELPSELRDQVVAETAIAAFLYSRDEAKSLLTSLSYTLRNRAWGLIAGLLVTGANIGDPIGPDISSSEIHPQLSNDLLFILENIEQDQAFTRVLLILTQAIENPHSQLDERQRLDSLSKLETLVEVKLPDRNNIRHNGYKIMCRAAIERAKRLSAKRSRTRLPRNHKQIIGEAKSIDNIADRAFVFAKLGELFHDVDDEDAINLLQGALALCNQIPNAKDRIGRLESVSKAFATINKTDDATAAIELAAKLAESVGGYDRDAIIASIIQTAHQFNPDLAAAITEKEEQPISRTELSDVLASLGLARSPQKLLNQYAVYSNDSDILSEAAESMLISLVGNKGTSHPKRVIQDWLSILPNHDFDTVYIIGEWAVETLLRQHRVAGHSQGQLAAKIVDAVMQSLDLLQSIGGFATFLSDLPHSVKENLVGLASKSIYFRVGDREKVVQWIADWLQVNAKGFIKICDPYFDVNQLWILKYIPTDINVSILTTGHQFQLTPGKITRDQFKSERRRITTTLRNGWASLSQQEPPPTLIAIHSEVFEGSDDFHDRYIITSEAGLALGTSLNGFGNKEFFISSREAEDARQISEIYIDPKLSMQHYFSQAIFINLDD